LDSGAIIRRLLTAQKLGVLATREDRRPYQSLVAFVVSADLKHIYFATEEDTRKHSNLVKSPEVSMLFDDRGNAKDDFKRGIAVTALGKAEAVKPRSLKNARALFLQKHPTLAGFLKSSTCRMFQIKVKTYMVVTEFQRVAEYNPAE
jgi:nitroimidazol reductase NimA-like FMN-containing flavoprotein (pyridoxamine 5'-phosphate oxidase superfamily)